MDTYNDIESYSDRDHYKVNNKKSSLLSSSKSCRSLFFSLEKGKTDPGEIKEQKEEARDNFCHLNKCFLIKMKWYFSHFGLHRFIELVFQCDKCRNKICIHMEKTQKGKYSRKRN